MSRGRLIFNCTLIVAALVTAAISYPSEFAGYAFFFAMIGLFVTAGKLCPFSFADNKSVVIIVGIFAAVFSCIFILMLI